MPFKGYKQSKKHKRKLGEASKGENNPMFGRKHTEESKRKISEAKKGEKHPRWGKRNENNWDNLFVFESKPDHMRYERFLRRK